MLFNKEEGRAVKLRSRVASFPGRRFGVLDEAQFARVLGPAAEIAFLAVDHGGVRRVLADAALPPAPGGLLLIRSDQIEALNARRVSASHRRIAAYLRDVTDGDVGGASDEELLRHVAISDETGRRLGLSGEAAHCRWALLMLLSQGQILHHKPAEAFMSRSSQSPDQQIEALFDLTIAAMRRDLNRQKEIL